MPRTLHDKKLDTRTSRERLKIRREPYWRAISRGMAIGYRKGAKGGTWIAKLCAAKRSRRYHALGTADDVVDADGAHALSFAQAQEAARQWFAELARSDRGEPQGGPYTVKECLQDYLTWLEGQGTQGKSTRYKAESLIIPQLGDMECASLTTTILQKWLRKLAASPARLRTRKGATQKYREIMEGDEEAIRRRRASANRTLTILKAALNQAWREERIASDHAWKRVQPFLNVDAPRVRYLSMQETKRFLNACAPDFRRLAQAALVSGARYGELARLRASDFNPDSDTILVRMSKSRKSRYIILNEEGAAFFGSLAAGKAGDTLLLPKADGSAWAHSHQKRPTEKACERAIIDPPASFHVMRHTWASHAVMAGVPLMIVARNMGHADTRMVEKHYGHLAPSYIADAIRASAPNFGIKPERDVIPMIGKK